MAAAAGFGFAGVIAVIALFAWLLVRAYAIGRQAARLERHRPVAVAAEGLRARVLGPGERCVEAAARHRIARGDVRARDRRAIGRRRHRDRRLQATEMGAAAL